MCGPSKAEYKLSGEQTNFFAELQQSYSQNFAHQQGILDSINKSLEPIIQGGPSQEGMSAAQKAGLTGQAINATAAANRNAQVVAGSAVGGNTGVTTGGQKQLQAGIASAAGTSLSNQENNINLTSAQMGRENFFNAEQGLAGAASQYNPNATAGQADSAGGQAFGEVSAINQQNNQMQADIGGAVAGLALAPFTGGASLGAGKLSMPGG